MHAADFQFIGGLGRTQQAAQHMLRDFAASGVDEDLEELRSMWKKPPSPPESDEDDDGAFGFGYTRHKVGFQPKKVPWQGALDGPRRLPAQRKPPREKRVHSGALDYRSAERLSTLSLLRQVSEADDLLLGSSGTASDSMAMRVPP